MCKRSGLLLAVPAIFLLAAPVWAGYEEGKVRVAQVDGQGCALILADTWPEKIGKGLMFISLNFEPEAQVAAIDALRAEFEAKGVAVKEGSWGYRLLVVDDPDGNQLFFNYPVTANRR